MLIEGLLVEHGVLSPHTGQYLMRRKAEPLAVADSAETPRAATAAIR